MGCTYMLYSSQAVVVECIISIAVNLGTTISAVTFQDEQGKQGVIVAAGEGLSIV